MGSCSDSSIALPWEYAAFWCKASIRTGVDNSGGAGNAYLTDTTADFETLGVVPGVGMTLYNITQDTSGPITAITPDTITATGVSWDDGDSYRVVTMTANEETQIQLYLDITAADVYAAIAASGACDCNWTTWGEALVKKLNIIEAAVFHSCPCAEPKLTDDQKTAYMEFVNTQMDKIITGELDICGGTGSDFPSIGWAEQASTEFAAGKIIVNDIERNL